MSAAGTFEVKLTPQSDENAPAGRMVINKQFTGGLVASGTGQMISKRTEKGASAYAAVEEVAGTLDGKRGTFTLIHNGYMSAEEQTLDIYILQGSGTGELENISGSMDIIQEDNLHKYVLNYQL